ncbi:hypothetical protein RJ639_035073, partial [Escallonia herrerae]
MTFPISRHSKASYVLVITLLPLFSEPISSLSLQPLPKNPSNFDPQIALFGDAIFINSDPTRSVRLTRPAPSSSGLLLHGKPFRFLKPTSFSTDFTFSISPQTRVGLALIIARSDFPSKFSSKTETPFGLHGENRFLEIEFDKLVNGNVGVGVSGPKSASISNASLANVGVKLQSWVDYDASSKRLEVRLGGFGSSRPYDPLLAYPIDLAGMWEGEEVVVGLSSFSGHSVQSSSVYSWSFRVRSVPKSMHSQPINPQGYTNEFVEEQERVQKKSGCALGVISGLFFATGCGVLAAIVLLILWAMFVDKNLIIPADDGSVHPVDFSYEKINVIVEKSLEDVKKDSRWPFNERRDTNPPPNKFSSFKLLTRVHTRHSMIDVRGISH